MSTFTAILPVAGSVVAGSGATGAASRPSTLEAARGQVVAWFDDDDWQHPKRLSTLVPLLRDQAERLGASFIGPSESFFLDVWHNRAEPYRVPRYPIFNGSIYYTEMVRHAPFPEDVIRTEDTRWISRLLRDRQGAVLVGNYPYLFFWLSHDANVTNRRQVRRLEGSPGELFKRLGSAWADTPRQLSDLRRRLKNAPASRPLRDRLAEGGGSTIDHPFSGR